jgi:hypothetical protein
MTESSLRDSLAERLNSRTYECCVCSECMGRGDPIWHCQRCYGIIHAACARFWARSRPAGEATVPCPYCRAPAPAADVLHEDAVAAWRCFCGKTQAPRPDPTLTPGCCDLVCGRAAPGGLCPHRCPLPCHPGPCAECNHTRTISCGCGASSKSVPCASIAASFACGGTCGKPLQCGVHKCAAKCHEGPCAECAVSEAATCWCGESTRTVHCPARASPFGCGRPCGGALSCGIHKCPGDCHAPVSSAAPCGDCPRMPSVATRCACGKAAVADLKGAPVRTACTDPLASCGAACDRLLPCGIHRCSERCHDGPCAPCPIPVTLQCRCGKGSVQVACFVQHADPVTGAIRAVSDTGAAVELLVPQPVTADAADDDDESEPNPVSGWIALAEKWRVPRRLIPQQPLPVRCPRHCRMKLTCGKHTCEEVCCPDAGQTADLATGAHVCPRTCQRRLDCGQHTCGRLCHSGARCPPCQHFSAEPLYCRCRRTILEPPVPCGSPPPTCNHPCALPRPCGHRAQHACHMTGECPPCAVPVRANCASHGVAMQWNTPCFQALVSCGRACGRLCPRCQRPCAKPCHGDKCPSCVCGLGPSTRAMPPAPQAAPPAAAAAAATVTSNLNPNSAPFVPPSFRR